MPPIPKFQKEDIINIAYEIAKEEGLEGINARKIAKTLGCSVQPIFHNFTAMEDVNKAVYEKMYNKYKEYMNNARQEKEPYKHMGLAYIKFAKDYPEFFKAIFMQKTTSDAEGIIVNDDLGNDIINAGIELTGLSYEEQKKFHVKVWIFTHGIACLSATKTVDFTEEEVEDLLKKTVREMFIGYLKERKDNNE